MPGGRSVVDGPAVAVEGVGDVSCRAWSWTVNPEPSTRNRQPVGGRCRASMRRVHHRTGITASDSTPRAATGSRSSIGDDHTRQHATTGAGQGQRRRRSFPTRGRSSGEVASTSAVPDIKPVPSETQRDQRRHERRQRLPGAVAAVTPAASSVTAAATAMVIRPNRSTNAGDQRRRVHGADVEPDDQADVADVVAVGPHNAPASSS